MLFFMERHLWLPGKQLRSLATVLDVPGPGLCYGGSLLFPLTLPPHPYCPPFRTGAAPPGLLLGLCFTASVNCLLSASLSGSLSVCFAYKSPKREHLFGWIDTGLWAMLSN